MPNYSGSPQDYIRRRVQDASDAYKASVTPQTVQQPTGAYGSIQSIYDNALTARIAEMESAYKMTAADQAAAKARIPQTYQAQANSLSANMGREKQNFNEYAAATGLNSGAGGQAALAMSGALQGGLSTLRTGEANALSDADLQMEKLKQQYLSMQQTAKAQSDFQRAQAMLDQQNRDTEAARQQAQFDANIGFQREQFQYGQTQDTYDNQLAQAKLLASIGDYSGFKAMGWTDAQIAQAMPTAPTYNYTPSPSPSPSPYPAPTPVTDTGTGDVGGNAKEFISMAKKSKTTPAQVGASVAAGLQSGYFTEAEADYILSQYGF